MSRRPSILAKIAVIAILCLSWLLVFARAIPLRDGDRGIFASMAERLAAGDVLYVDVWDNKEPLFYLTLATGRLVSPYMDVVIELGWLLASAIAVFAILRAAPVSGWMAALIGFGATPLILTGGDYAAGFSHLPGTALVLGTYALLVARRPVLAGALLPVLATFKVVMVPMALAVFAVDYALRRSRSAALGSLIGAGIAAALLTLLLALRGELRGYVDLLLSNIGYSQSGIQSGVGDAYPWPIWNHLEPVFRGPAMATTAGTVLVLALTWALARGAARGLWWTTATTLAAALAVTAATGLWSHHAQILFGPAALAAALLVASFPPLHRVTAAALVVSLALTAVLAGAPSLRETADTLLSARARAMDLSRVAAPTHDLQQLAPEGGSYARLGKNTDDSHAQGLRAFSHPCRQFVQYTYDLPSTLEFIPTCLPRVDYVIVDRGFVPEEGHEEWNRFVARSEEVLTSDFTCEQRAWGRLCTNRAVK